MASHSLGLTLHEAARQKGVPFTVENEPVDRQVQVNGMNFHYLEWGHLLQPPGGYAPRRLPAGP